MKDFFDLIRGKYESNASHPGGVSLSTKKLKQLQPEWTGFAGVLEKLKCIYDLDIFPTAYLKHHLKYGDSRAAVVVSVKPLLVAAYTDELDCVAMLNFPKRFAAAYQLEVGSRLLTVNTYETELETISDLKPGPLATRYYKGFTPLIADFLSEDKQRIETRKAEIESHEWQRALEQGQAYRRENPGLSRDGSPKTAGIPAKLPGEAWRSTRPGA